MARKVITLMGDPIVNEEEPALAAITPGHLLTLSATGVTPNVTAASKMAALFALERDEMGNDIDDAYAIGDYVKVGHFAPGMRVYALLASGQNITKGAYLTGNTTAGLLIASADDDDIVCQALESVDASGSAPVAGTRIRVQIV
jgi:hypothetical protein